MKTGLQEVLSKARAAPSGASVRV